MGDRTPFETRVAAHHVRKFLEAKAKMGPNVDSAEVHSIWSMDEKHTLTVADLWALVEEAER